MFLFSARHHIDARHRLFSNQMMPQCSVARVPLSHHANTRHPMATCVIPQVHSWKLSHFDIIYCEHLCLLGPCSMQDEDEDVPDACVRSRQCICLSIVRTGKWAGRGNGPNDVRAHGNRNRRRLFAFRLRTHMRSLCNSSPRKVHSIDIDRYNRLLGR